jgi:hypothetical protein
MKIRALNHTLNHTLTPALSHFVGEGETGIGRNIQNSYSPTGRPDIRQPITPTLHYSNTPILPSPGALESSKESALLELAHKMRIYLIVYGKRSH